MGGGGEGKREGISGSKGKRKRERVIFEIHSDLTYSFACTHERNETISRLVSAPQPPMYTHSVYLHVHMYKIYTKKYIYIYIYTHAGAGGQGQAGGRRRCQWCEIFCRSPPLADKIATPAKCMMLRFRQIQKVQELDKNATMPRSCA